MQLLPNKRNVEPVAPATSPTNGSSPAKGMEFALVLVLFFGLGWLLDRALGTSPWCSLALLTLGVVGQFARVWYAYDEEMRAHERRLFANRSAARAARGDER